MENKVNKIDLKIPLPFPNYSMQDALKLKEIDILRDTHQIEMLEKDAEIGRLMKKITERG